MKVLESNGRRPVFFANGGRGCVFYYRYGLCGKIIVDTNIPLDILREIADSHHVAVMLSPQRMSVEEFFNREDEEKQFILQRIYESPDPEKTLANYKACIARVNSEERYREYAESGFYVLERRECSRDTRQEVLKELENHFRL